MIRRVVVLLWIVLAWSASALAQAPLRVHFLDVGQGDAVLIQSPSGQSVLYDGGDSPTRIIAHLTTLGVQRLDLVIASHNHADHIGGLAEVIRRLKPRFYMDNGVAATTLVYHRVLQAVQDTGTQLLEATSRQVLLGEKTSLTILPPPGIAGWEQNNNAVGVIVTHGEFRMSLGGDAESRQWRWWIDNYRPLLRPVHVHKASHHGSENGDISASLGVLSPEAVVISVGARNGYQHPRPEALRLYADQRSVVYRTDLSGTVVVEANLSGNYTIHVERDQAVRRPPVSQTSAPPR